MVLMKSYSGKGRQCSIWLIVLLQEDDDRRWLGHTKSTLPRMCNLHSSSVDGVFNANTVWVVVTQAYEHALPQTMVPQGPA